LEHFGRFSETFLVTLVALSLGRAAGVRKQNCLENASFGIEQRAFEQRAFEQRAFEQRTSRQRRLGQRASRQLSASLSVQDSQRGF
jgi:hypothetical protein